MRTSNSPQGAGRSSGSARVDQPREAFYAAQLASMREILTPGERAIFAAARRALFIGDVLDRDGNVHIRGALSLYLAGHPKSPEEGLSGAEVRMETDSFDYDVEDLAEHLSENEDYADLPQASDPSPTEPGTESRMYDYYRRYVAGRNVFHPGDVPRDPCDHVGAGVSRGPNGRAQREALRLVTDEDEDDWDDMDPVVSLRMNAAAGLRRLKSNGGAA